MLFLLASVTDFFLDPIVEVSTDFISSTGYVAIFILMALESACLPVPSEAIMLFAGFSVSDGELTLFGITAAGVLGNLVGSWAAYAVGYYGRLEILEKNRFIHLPPKYLKWADDWFAKYGDATVFFTRMLPIIRTFISLPAGIARMPFWRFTTLTLIGCIPWVLMLGAIGKSVGDNWEEWRDKLHYIDYAVVVGVVMLLIWLVIRRWRGGSGGDKDETQTSSDTPSAPGDNRTQPAGTGEA
jgi:membrane protein DedA with SNARE-associated domain